MERNVERAAENRRDRRRGYEDRKETGSKRERMRADRRGGRKGRG